jgi:hypothetical protein
MSNYPAQIDTSASLPTAVDNFTPVKGDVFNRLRDAVLAVESELGVKPSGNNATVRARLDNLDNIFGNLQIIELAQDLGGTLESPLVIGLQGRPLSSVGPNVNEVITWNGIAWVPAPPKGLIDVFLSGDLGGTKYSQTVIGLQNHPISTTAPLPGQLLTWNGTNWIPGFSPPGPSSANVINLVAGPFTTNSATPVRIGARDFDISFYPATIGGLTRQVKFIAIIESTINTATCQVQLQDVTNGVTVTGTTGTTSTSSGLVVFNSGALTVGTSNGNIRTDMIPIYEVQLSMPVGNIITDRAICVNARLEITYS